MVSQLSEIWSGFSIPDPDPDFLPIPDPDPVSQIPNPGVKKAPEPWYRIPDPDSQHLRFWLCSGCRGYCWLLTGRCCFNNSFNGSALRSFYVQKRIFSIFYLNIISPIFTVFKLWCPAHLFPNTPRISHIVISLTYHPARVKIVYRGAALPLPLTLHTPPSPVYYTFALSAGGHGFSFFPCPHFNPSLRSQKRLWFFGNNVSGIKYCKAFSSFKEDR